MLFALLLAQLVYDIFESSPLYTLLTFVAVCLCVYALIVGKASAFALIFRVFRRRLKSNESGGDASGGVLAPSLGAHTWVAGVLWLHVLLTPHWVFLDFSGDVGRYGLYVTAVVATISVWIANRVDTGRSTAAVGRE